MTRDELILKNIGLAYHIARKWERSAYHYRLCIEDVRSTALIGLVKAADGFNPDKCVKFVTFATMCISNEIGMFFRRERKQIVPVSEYVEDENGEFISLFSMIGDDDDLTGIEVEIDYLLSCLSQRDRSILQMRMEGLNINGIAKRLGVSQSYASRLLTAIRKKLAHILAERDRRYAL